jgi:hypothetical protein
MLALSVLIALTVPMLALLSASAVEPLIARNLVDATRALYLAEAGIEWAIDLLANAPDWDIASLSQAGNPANNPPPLGMESEGPAATLVAPADLLPWGTTVITARRGTGEDTSLGEDEVAVLTSIGMVNGAQRTIEVVVRRAGGGAGQPPSAPGALSQPALVSWRER